MQVKTYTLKDELGFLYTKDEYRHYCYRNVTDLGVSESWLCHFLAVSSVSILMAFACQMQVVPSSKGVLQAETEGMSSIASGGLVA